MSFGGKKRLRTRRHTEEALDASSERWAAVFDFGPNSHLVLDRQGTMLDIDLTGARMIVPVELVTVARRGRYEPIVAAAIELEMSAALPALHATVAIVTRSARRGARSPDPPRALPVPEAEPGGQLGTILLVEDHAGSAEMLARVLEHAGYGVCVAHSAREARAAMGSGIDLIVSDVGLPDGNGHDLVAELRSVKPVPAIALSGYGSADDLRKSAEAGFVAHLTKPVALRVLLGAIRAAMRGTG